MERKEEEEEEKESECITVHCLASILNARVYVCLNDSNEKWTLNGTCIRFNCFIS